MSKEFLEHYLLTGEGLLAMHRAKSIGVPALISLYRRLAKNDILLRQLKVALDHGQIMPNIPQMGRFFGAVGTALEIATDGQTFAQETPQEAAANMRGE